MSTPCIVNVLNELVTYNDNYETDRLQKRYMENVINLLDADLTVPYISRYRRSETGGLDADKIREIQRVYAKYKKVALKVESVLKKVGTEISDSLVECFKNAKSVEEVEELYLPFKKEGKGTLAERARRLGLEEVASEFLKHPFSNHSFKDHVNPTTKGLSSLKEVSEGVMHIVSSMIAKDGRVKDILQKEISHSHVCVHTKASNKGKEKDVKQKYSNYYNFDVCVSRLLSHQIMAINRGEENKVLAVKFEINHETKKRVLQKIMILWIPKNATKSYYDFLNESINDSFKRLIEKNYLRQVRGTITKAAERECVNVFSRNLKQLYLMAPVKNKTVLSVDPGFKHGCKVAVLDSAGVVLETCIVYPFTNERHTINEMRKLVDHHCVDIIGIGNGTACRETESFITKLIKSYPEKEIQYCIVNESGASTYSVTEDAKKEFGALDPNIISAISIGRRLQDPLSELVKIEAKHVGVGMYQHDVNKSLLQAAVDEVVEDCVSFVGVDLNTSSVQLLKHVAGLNKKQSQAIVDYRTKNGGFRNRRELQKVKGIGDVTFRNCAGFVRISIADDNKAVCREENNTAVTDYTRGKRKLVGSNGAPKCKKYKSSNELSTEILDRTWIHPEIYNIAYKVLEYLKLSVDVIGTNEMRRAIKEHAGTPDQLNELERFVESDANVVKLILDGFQKPADYDVREGFVTPMFKRGITSFSQITLGNRLTGIVRNCTTFGVFVDVGLESDALIPMKHSEVLLATGNRVECEVCKVEQARRRVTLSLVKVLSISIKLQ